MQQIPALGGVAVAVELLIAGDAPDVGSHVVLTGEDLLGLERLVQDGAAAEQVRARLPRLRLGRAEPVHPFQDALTDPLGHGRRLVLLVHERDVVEDALAFPVHPPDAVLDDHRDLVSEGRVVGNQIRHGHRQQVAVPVLMLQPFARQRRAARGAAEQEPARPRIGGRPDEVADPLHAEHRVVDEERNDVDAVGRVGGARRDERRDRPGLGDPFFEDLPLGGFLVVQQRVHVDRLVQLADVGVDANLPEERLHAERARLVRDDRDDQLANLLVAQQLRQHPHERHRRRRLAPLAPLVELGKELGKRVGLERLQLDDPLRDVAAELLPPLAHVRDFRTVVGRPIERRLRHLLIGDRDAEARAERPELAFVHLLLLVRDVLALARLADAVPLDGAGKDDRRLPGMLDGRLVGGVHLDGIVAAERQLLQLLVGQVLHHVEQPRIGAPELLADGGARFDGVLLILPVDHLAHALHEEPLVVLLEQRVPLAAPDHLDDVPPGAAEDRLELLDDLAVAADRAVEPLQIAVDDEDQVVELLAGGERDGAEAFGLVGLAVADIRPHLRIGPLLEAAVLEVPHEPRLIDRADRPEPHRDRRKLPEVWHQPRMRIGREAAARLQLAAEVPEAIGTDPPFDEGARVNARRRVPLEVDDVAVVVRALALEKVIEADLVERRGRRIGRNVPADPLIQLVGAHDHRQRIPADQALDAPFDLTAARKGRLLRRRNGIDVGGVGGEGQADAVAACMIAQRAQELPDPGRSARLQHVVERLEPFAGFERFQLGRIFWCRATHVSS